MPIDIRSSDVYYFILNQGGAMKDPKEGHDSKHGHHAMYQKMMQISGSKGGYHRDQVFDEDKRSDYL